MEAARGSRGNTVRENRSAGLAFVDVLTAEFMERGQRVVSLEVIERRFASVFPEVSSVDSVSVIGSLVRRLTTGYSAVFLVEGDVLALGEQAACDPEIVSGALEHFRETFEP